ELAGAHVDLDRWQQELRRGQRLVARGPFGDELVFADAVVHLHVLRPFLGDGRFPGKTVAPGRLVVVAHEQPRFWWEVENAPDRTVETARIAARKVGACGAVIRHEHRVAYEYRVADLVGHAGRRMAGRVYHFAFQAAQTEAFPVLEQVIELGAGPGHVIRIEHRAEDLLHVANVFADADRRTGL